MSDSIKLSPEHRQALLRQTAAAMRDDARCGEDRDWVYNIMLYGYKGLRFLSDDELLAKATELKVVEHMVEYGQLPDSFLSRVASSPS